MPDQDPVHVAIVPDVPNPSEWRSFTMPADADPTHYILRTGVIEPGSFRQHWRVATVTDESPDETEITIHILKHKLEHVPELDDDEEFYLLEFAHYDGEYQTCTLEAPHEVITRTGTELAETAMYNDQLPNTVPSINDLFVEAVAIEHPQFARDFDPDDPADHERLVELLEQVTETACERANQ